MELWKEHRFQELIIMSHYGGTQRWQALKTQELFAKRIMPMLRAEAEQYMTAMTPHIATHVLLTGDRIDEHQIRRVHRYRPQQNSK